MPTERKPLYLTLNNIHQFELPTTASAVGIDLNTGKQLYYNTSSLGWAVQTGFSGSVTKLTDGSDYLIASGAVSLTTTSLGAINILVHEDAGNWTPVLSLSNGTSLPTLSSTAGRYYKIGRHVTLNFALTVGSLNGGTGNVTLINLPFLSETSNDGAGAGSVPEYVNISNTNQVSGISIHVKSNATTADLFHVSNKNTASEALLDTNLTESPGTQLTGSLYYIAAQ
jgi:hypothetical protein